MTLVICWLVYWIICCITAQTEVKQNVDKTVAPCQPLLQLGQGVPISRQLIWLPSHTVIKGCSLWRTTEDEPRVIPGFFGVSTTPMMWPKADHDCWLSSKHHIDAYLRAVDFHFYPKVNLSKPQTHPVDFSEQYPSFAVIQAGIMHNSFPKTSA